MTQPHSKDDVLSLAELIETGMEGRAERLKAATMLRAYTEVVAPQFSVGDLVLFQDKPYVIECHGGYRDTFDLKVRDDEKHHWLNVPAYALTAALSTRDGG